MKIGFDISQTGKGKAGCGYYADAMIRSLTRIAPNDLFVLFTSFGDFYFDDSVRTLHDVRQKNIEYAMHFRRREDAARLWRSVNLDAQLGRLDLVHANNYWCPRQLVKTRLVYTLYDLGFIENPEWTTETNRVGCFEGVFGAAVAADWIISISQASRENFLRIFPSFPSDRIEVIYPASRFVGLQSKGKPPNLLTNIEPGRFWLSVGTIEPRKNLRRLVEAFLRYINAGGSPIPLVMAGGAGWLMDDFSKWLVDVGATDHVIITGYVTDDELIWLYSNCVAHVYLSLWEGFGLPVLEGMQFGAPTIASRSTSIPEIVGDAGILLDPLDTESIARALLEIDSQPERRQALSREARRRASDFNADQSARQLHELYCKVIAAPKRRIPLKAAGL